MAISARRMQIEEMLRTDPADAFLRYALAMEWVGEGNDTEAARVFEQIRVDTPDYVPTYFQNAQVLIRLGDGANAHAVLQKGIEIARKAGDFHAAGEMDGLLAGIG